MDKAITEIYDLFMEFLPFFMLPIAIATLKGILDMDLQKYFNYKESKNV